MAEPARRVEEVTEQSRRVARQARPWLIGAARTGHAAKGVVYGLVGALSAAAALGQRGRPANSEDALAVLLGAPARPALVGLVAFGLVAYARGPGASAWIDPSSDVRVPGRHGTSGVCRPCGD